MKTKQRWQDWTVFVLGLWLVASPFIGIGVNNDVAAINSYTVGSVVIIISLLAITKPEIWEEYINIALGAWLLISPFVLGFSNISGPTSNQIFIGLLITLSALAVTLNKTTPKIGHGSGHT
ncbi:MAG: SPW repeat protein [Gammaproteobacteria bacterium]